MLSYTGIMVHPQGWVSPLLALGIYSMTAKGDGVNKTAGAEGCIHPTKHRHLLQHNMSCALSQLC